MRITTTLLTAALGSLAAAQLGNLPACAQRCFGNSLGSCAQLDVACICRNTTLITNLSCCVATTCTGADQNSTIQLANNLCGAAGVPVPTSAACTGGASPSSTPSPTSSGNRNTTSATATTSHASGSPSASGTARASGNTAPMATAGVMGIAMGIMGAVFAL